MIIFQALDNWQIDLTNFGLTFNEESDYFGGDISKSYTFPINMDLDDDLARKFGLVDLENISNYKIKINGYLLVDDDFYDAYVAINEVQGSKVELKFFYGKEILPVFDKKLSQLPWPTVDTGGSLTDYAESQLIKSYPAATHNFPKVYRPEIAQGANYKEFQLFVNHYASSQFLTNNYVVVEGESVPFNRNVMAPMAYIMEILRLGFQSEGLDMRGEFVNDAVFRKVVIIPDKYFDFYSDPAQRSSWSFEFYDSQETVDGKTINIYERTFTPTTEGSYFIKYKLAFPAGIADFFQLKITYGAEVLFFATAEGLPFNLEDVINLNLVDVVSFDDVKVELKLTEQSNTIANLNHFYYDFKGGNLNQFPTEYSLADFMPDITFRTFFNAIKKWANLDVTYYERSVYLNFLDNSIQRLTYDDHTGMQMPLPKRTLNTNNLFKLSYPDKREILVANSGQVYSSDGYTDNEIQTIEIPVLPLEVLENEGVVTGAYPKNGNADILLGIYNGIIDGQPAIVDKVGTRSLSLQNMYDNFYKYFLSFRANSEQYKDTFNAHITKRFNLKNGIFKYNKKHLIKSIRKRRISEQWWQIDQETESF